MTRGRQGLAARGRAIVTKILVLGAVHPSGVLRLGSVPPAVASRLASVVVAGEAEAAPTRRRSRTQTMMSRCLVRGAPPPALRPLLCTHVTLAAALARPNAAVKSLVQDWLSTLQDTPDTAYSELLDFVFQACGVRKPAVQVPDNAAEFDIEPVVRAPHGLARVPRALL